MGEVVCSIPFPSSWHCPALAGKVLPRDNQSGRSSLCSKLKTCTELQDTVYKCSSQQKQKIVASHLLVSTWQFSGSGEQKKLITWGERTRATHSELCMCSVSFSILTCVNFQNWLQFQEQYYLNKTHKYRKIFLQIWQKWCLSSHWLVLSTRYVRVF